MSRAARRGRRRAIVFGVVVALALPFAGESALRASGAPKPWDYSGVRGWTLPASQSRYVDQPDPMPDFALRTNADGLRTELARARTPGVRRVAVVGDSTVFGWGVSAEDALPARLGAALGPGWEALNAGQPGYSSEQVWRLVDGVVAHYAPDVLVFVQPFHDILTAERPDAAWFDGAPPTLLEWIRTESRLYARLRAARPQGPQRPPDDAERADPDRVMRVAPARRAEVRAAMRARLPDAGFVVAVLPTEHELRNGYHAGGEFSEELGGWCAQAGVPFLDLRDTFGPGPADLGRLTLPGDAGHFTRTGADALAARLAEGVRAVAEP
jgi:lysophospholipase L1-like esterase